MNRMFCKNLGKFIFSLFILMGFWKVNCESFEKIEKPETCVNESEVKFEIRDLIPRLKDVETAELTLNLNRLSNSSLKFRWVPSLGITLDGEVDGNFGEGVYDLEAVPSISVNQLLLGGMNLWAKVKIPVEFSRKDYSGLEFRDFENGENYKWEWISSFGVNIPLINGKKTRKLYNSYLMEEYTQEEKSSLLNYKINIEKAREDFSGKLWSYLYCKKFRELMNQEILLYEKLYDDKEKLFKAGRSSVLDMAEAKTHIFELIQEKLEYENIMLSMEKNLCEIGVDCEQINFNLGHVLEWISGLCEQLGERESYVTDLKKIAAKRQFNQILVPYVQKFPVFQSSFSIDRDLNWKGALNIGFELFPEVMFGKKAESVELQYELYKKQVSSIENTEKFIQREREQSLHSRKVYSAEMNQYYLREKERYEGFEVLYECGKISQWDLNLQQLMVEKARLYDMDGKFQIYETALSFY